MGADEAEGFGKGDFEDLDVFAFVEVAASGVAALFFCVGGDEVVDFFADGAGGGVAFEDFFEGVEFDAEFFDGFVAGGDGGVGVVEDAAAAFEEQGFFGVSDVYRHAELAGEEDVAGFGTEGEQGDGVAAVEELAFLVDPMAVDAAETVADAVKGGPGGAVLVVVEDFDLGGGAGGRPGWRRTGAGGAGTHVSSVPESGWT